MSSEGSDSTPEKRAPHLRSAVRKLPVVLGLTSVLSLIVGGTLVKIYEDNYQADIIDKLTRQPDLLIHVAEDVDLNDSSFYEVLPEDRTIDQKALRAARDRSEVRLAMREAGAVAANFMTLHVVLEDQTARRVRITNMRVVVQRRAPVLNGTEVFGPAEKGIESNLQIGFNLDEANPVAESLDSEQLDTTGFGGHYFTDHSLSLIKDESLSLVVLAQVQRSYAEWIMELDAVVDGEEKVYKIDKDGAPFKTTGLRPDVPNTEYQDYKHVYVASTELPPDFSVEKLR
jgi:hypothetical protein